MENSIYFGRYVEMLVKDGVLTKAHVMLQGSYWEVLPVYQGTDGGDTFWIENKITLWLKDDANMFIPVISKMSLEEAKKLRDDLNDVIRAKESIS